MNELHGYDIEDLKIGMHASFVKTITEADIVLFAAVSGDNNALHINQEFAQTTQFKGRIAHGMLSASVISAAIAGRLPGPGTNMGQNLRFKAPIRAGDTVHATVTVKELIPEKCRARLTTVCTVDGEIVIDGGCIGNDHVARSPKNLSLRADREGALVGPSAGDLIAKRRLRSKWAPTPRILV